ncbi:hypothetical protein [Brevundimonas sp.]|uniref:hypothetical protein n=1 Tax=Brevundimonas sp. TaxID=1871086 RepID=UPI0037BF2E73
MSNLDKSHLAIFYASIPDRLALSKGRLADYFAYYLQIEVGRESVTTAELKQCFKLCDLIVPTWVATHLANASKGKGPKYVKASKGYRLHAHEREQISKSLGVSAIVTQTSEPLRDACSKLNEGIQKEFLQEAIDCYGIGCNRAAIVIFWSFLLDHLYGLVLSNHLVSFNDTLSKNTDKRVKVTEISKRDDFGEIPEGKFIEFMKSSGIISNDVRKILDQKLGIRNSAAHPSTVSFKQSKANEFFEDLLENVYKKYPN